MKVNCVHRRRTMMVVGVVLSALLCGVSAEAQQTQAPQTNVSPSNSPYTDLSQYLIVGDQAVPRQAVTSAANATLSSTVMQTGQGNIANATLSGAGNVTNQIQTGAGNSSTLAVNGTQNVVSTAQIGNSNTTSIGISGNGNSISNLQVGSGLSYQIQVIGTSVPVSVQQYGRK
jgi:hypothetical protein